MKKIDITNLKGSELAEVFKLYSCYSLTIKVIDDKVYMEVEE